MDVVTYALLKKYIGTGLSEFLETPTGQAIIQNAVEGVVGNIVTTDEMNTAIETALTDVLITQP